MGEPGVSTKKSIDSKSCKLVELSASGERRLKLTIPTDEQVQLTKILADKSLLEEENIQQLMPTG